jgi:hypothetical protein
MVGSGSVNMIQGEQYGTPTMRRYAPQSTSGVSGSGKRKKAIKL